MATALPYITTAITAYSAYKAGNQPGLPAVRDAGDPDDVKKKRMAQQEEEKRTTSGRANTVLTGSQSLG